MVILHEGNHNTDLDVHKIYALDNNYLILPRSGNGKPYGKIFHEEITGNSIKLYINLDITNVTTSNKFNVQVNFVKESGSIQERSLKVTYYDEENEVICQHTHATGVTQSIDLFIKSNGTDLIIAKVKNYVHLSDGESIGSETRFYYSQAVGNVVLPTEDVTNFTNVKYKYQSNEHELLKISGNKSLTALETTEIINKTITRTGQMKLFLKIGIAQVTSSGTCIVRINQNETNMYQYTMRLDNVSTNICDIFTIINFNKNDVLTVTIENKQSGNLQLIGARTQLYTETI
jgi:hypothetical protein